MAAGGTEIGSPTPRATDRPRAMLLHQVWKISDQSERNVVDVYVNYVRRKLNMDPTHRSFIRSVVRGT
jgi:DNA-binding response OmpR family regulator